jgi:hypothetical protein
VSAAAPVPLLLLRLPLRLLLPLLLRLLLLLLHLLLLLPCRFDLAIQLGDLEVAADIGNSLDTPAKWKQLGKGPSTALGEGSSSTTLSCYTSTAQQHFLSLSTDTVLPAHQR